MWSDERSARYEERIKDAATVADLRGLLGHIISAALPEKDFTELYVQVTARRAALLKKSGAEIWDKHTG